ncbi:uncharacterized protein TRUGW13939_08774 [Talaromyces rugulosus]|uniref:Uncharacterized protein n=1 Tax=Talaromyces rugulosus TaxID=121627 RepID=A0A7H8R5I6_TALRU|nr:uncharacterized protein TRUGW13939_08774 [Talaromyces rugulosus]QKX61622.1 hypothetical protein TRUGW13939_08774 [Talaromyces rugulosus]
MSAPAPAPGSSLAAGSGPSPAGPPPGDFDLDLDIDTLCRCEFVRHLGQEVHRVFRHYEQVPNEQEAANWLRDYREDLRLLWGVLGGDDPNTKNNMLARVKSKFPGFDAWRRGLGPAPWE